MDSIYVRQRLRPSRYAFLVDNGDLAATLQAVSINCALWGGAYNPIIPLDPRDVRDGLLKAFDCDMLVSLTERVSPDVKERFEYHIIERNEIVTTDNFSGKRILRLGFNILPILRHLYETDVRFSKEASYAVLTAPEEAEGWAEYSAFAFGSFRWLPKLDFNFEEAYTKSLNAEKLDLPVFQIPEKLGRIMLPIHVSRQGLTIHGGRASMSKTVFYVGNHKDGADLINFWNLRATGRTVLFIPLAAYRSFESLMKNIPKADALPTRFDQMINIQKGADITTPEFDEVCNWIGGFLIPAMRRERLPVYGVETEGYVGDIHVATLQARDGEELSTLHDSKMSPVKLIQPPYIEPGDEGFKRYTWSVEINMSGAWNQDDLTFNYPKEPAVESILRRKMHPTMPGEFRIGRSGIVLQEDSLKARFYPSPVTSKEVIQAIFKQYGITAKPSEPGQYAEQIIRKMGSLQFDCRIFKIRGVRDILDRLGNGSILTKGNMSEIVMSTQPGEYGQNWRPQLYEGLYIVPNQRGPFNFTNIFNLLLEKQIIRPGFQFKCSICFKEDWYHVSEFNEEYVCRYCFRSQRVNFGSFKEWQYKADGIFQIPDSGQGSVGVIISLWRLQEVEHSNTAFMTSHNLSAADGFASEIDYAFFVSGYESSNYQMVIGQATRFGEITAQEIEKITNLADRFAKKPFLAFTTLRDGFSDNDKQRLLDLNGRGYTIIAMSREEVDPYDLYERFENAPHKYPHGLTQFSESTFHVNVGS